jgi:iron complex outermembrane receptor protein
VYGLTATSLISKKHQGHRKLDSWIHFDAGARYATKIEGRPTTFRATVQNVFDREYWSGVASYGAFSPGYPRTLQLSATVDF